MQYELFYLVGASKEADLEKVKGEAEEIVQKAGGVFQEKTVLEKRRLSYEVKHETHGIYVARRFDLGDVEKINDITKKLNLNANILRFLISRADELPELKSKEERMNETAKADVKAAPREELKKPAAKKEDSQATKVEGESTEEKSKAKEPEDRKEKEEDIDKKLEEILNI